MKDACRTVMYLHFVLSLLYFMARRQ